MSVPPEIKFCGMTRAEDVDAAVAAGARYIGVVFARGRRIVGIEQARALMSHVPDGVGRVGVFGAETDPRAVGDIARAVGLDVVQLHADPDEPAVADARAGFGGAVWAAVRVHGSSLGPLAARLFRSADAVVLDAYSPHALGGTGVHLDWEALAPAVGAVRGPARLVLAGGLKPHTVSAAVRALRPDVVDVSSGVESAPGIKDHSKLRAFRAAVLGEWGATS